MQSFGLREEIFDKIKAVVQKFNYEFLIFGSRARGDYRNNSDIDIAVIGDVNSADELKIRDELDCIDMEYMIDVVFTCKLSNEELLENIKREGKRII